MPLRYTLQLNVMTGTPEYRDDAAGHMFMPLDQAARKSPPEMDYPQSAI